MKAPQPTPKNPNQYLMATIGAISGTGYANASRVKIRLMRMYGISSRRMDVCRRVGLSGGKKAWALRPTAAVIAVQARSGRGALASAFG